MDNNKEKFQQNHPVVDVSAIDIDKLIDVNMNAPTVEKEEKIEKKSELNPQIENKNSNNKKIMIAVVISCLITLLISCGISYFIMNKINKLESVEVNDNGLSVGIKKIEEAVVVIKNYQNGVLYGIGSGFFFDTDGKIMTNHHVVAGATNIKILLNNGTSSEEIEAKVLGSDEYADIAVIKVDSKYVTQIATLSSSDNINVGDTVFTIGSPISETYIGTITKGILSGKDRLVAVAVSSNSRDWIMNVMQTDASINPGNSGGPLCNINGEVIGINTMKIIEDEIEGVGFSIPIEEAKSYADILAKGEIIKRSYLGISMSDIENVKYYKTSFELDPSIKKGVAVMSVTKNGPCAHAGIVAGDVIVKLDEQAITNVAELRYYASKISPNTAVKMTIIRGRDTKVFNVILGES